MVDPSRLRTLLLTCSSSADTSGYPIRTLQVLPRPVVLVVTAEEELEGERFQEGGPTSTKKKLEE